MRHSLPKAGQAPAPRVPTAETTPPATGRVFADSSGPTGQAGGPGSERLPGRPFNPAQLLPRDPIRRTSVAAPGALVVGVHLLLEKDGVIAHRPEGPHGSAFYIAARPGMVQPGETARV
ncbi:hypothetical protein [Streptomyces sp. NBC_01237]|uniref:hypothetical protein n=1 Tax=Streptomyces sp. NBC_01237 TaxID=2903790 RepID=UPI002DD8C8BA|nr:hypothetical protein [Streptomyces sp. NBC_01237]WRZ77207.1 hypothetical protein OG251_36705 [Streptomyces sp. NBC_01237]